MRRASKKSLLFLLIILVTGCGGGFRAGDPWDPKEGRLFDDGVDTLDDLSKLSGEFGYLAEEELDARANIADMVAIVSVDSVQTNKDINGEEVKRMEVSVVKILYGQSTGNTVVLTSGKDSLGYSLILRHERHLSGEFIGYIRWFKKEDRTIGNHFHLSPNSEQIRTQVEKLLDARIKEEKIQGVQ